MRHTAAHLETEGEYFHRVDAEKIDEMRRRGALEEQRQRMEVSSHIHDPRILEALQHLGYDDVTIALIPLVPLVEVAWADESVSEAERDRITEIASRRGIEAGTTAYQHLMAWLDAKPADKFFQENWCAIDAALAAVPAADRDERIRLLLDCCTEVAHTSCMIFGWASRTCIKKMKLVERFRDHLQPAAHAGDANSAGA